MSCILTSSRTLGHDSWAITHGKEADPLRYHGLNMNGNGGSGGIMSTAGLELPTHGFPRPSFGTKLLGGGSD